MRFWDSSAIIPLIVEELETVHMVRAAQESDTLIVWWGTLLECRTGIARRFREGSLNPSQRAEALDLLTELSTNWNEVQPSTTLREVASRMVVSHSLRAGDALQLAAAYVVSLDRPSQIEFVTLDKRLAHAASLEGFRVPFSL